MHDAAGFGVVLQLFDSTISFHARYQRSRDIAALIEHVVLNLQNTRSIDWVVQTASGRLARLHEREAAGVEDLSDDIALRYFSHTDDARRSVGA